MGAAVVTETQERLDRALAWVVAAQRELRAGDARRSGDAYVVLGGPPRPPNLVSAGWPFALMAVALGLVELFMTTAVLLVLLVVVTPTYADLA